MSLSSVEERDLDYANAGKSWRPHELAQGDPGNPDGVRETAAAGRAPVPRCPVGQHRRTNHAGVDSPAAHRAAPSACRCTEHPDRSHRRCRTRTPHDVRRRSPYPDPRQNLQGRHYLQPIPHHGHVLPDSSIPPDRAEPPSCWKRTDRGVCQRLGRLLGRDSQDQRDRRRGASTLRLYHGRVGQMAQHACGTHHRRGPLRPLADRPRLRLFLWVSHRRSVAVRAQPGS